MKYNVIHCVLRHSLSAMVKLMIVYFRELKTEPHEYLNPNRSIQSSNQTSAELGRGRGKDFP
jgi:hypothetical protein